MRVPNKEYGIRNRIAGVHEGGRLQYRPKNSITLVMGAPRGTPNLAIRG